MTYVSMKLLMDFFGIKGDECCVFFWIKDLEVFEAIVDFYFMKQKSLESEFIVWAAFKAVDILKGWIYLQKVCKINKWVACLRMYTHQLIEKQILSQL